MSFKYNLLQSVAISHATELNMNLMMRVMVMMAFLPGWYLHHGSDVVAMKMILVTTLMLLVIMMMMRQ